MLSFSAWGELIFARTPWRAAQSRVSDRARQRAVGYMKIILLREQLLDVHDIAACTDERVLESGQHLRVCKATTQRSHDHVRAGCGAPYYAGAYRCYAHSS
jgi:hypothetical protein